MWSIEITSLQAEKDFESEMEYSIGEFLDMPYSAMEDLKGAKVEKQMIELIVIGNGSQDHLKKYMRLSLWMLFTFT